MSNPIHMLIELASLVLNGLAVAILIRALLSWFRPDPRNYFVQLIVKITDPVLRPLERVIPPLGGFDITPIIAIVLIQLVLGALPMLAGGY
ncbi:MAG: YggT family protein [Proteobacteria bacterium]|nr:YggT family protein [Pseudomonadota bacterium]